MLWPYSLDKSVTIGKDATTILYVEQDRIGNPLSVHKRILGTDLSAKATPDRVPYLCLKLFRAPDQVFIRTQVFEFPFI